MKKRNAAIFSTIFIIGGLTVSSMMFLGMDTMENSGVFFMTTLSTCLVMGGFVNYQSFLRDRVSAINFVRRYLEWYNTIDLSPETLSFPQYRKLVETQLGSFIEEAVRFNIEGKVLREHWWDSFSKSFDIPPIPEIRRFPPKFDPDLQVYL